MDFFVLFLIKIESLIQRRHEPGEHRLLLAGSALHALVGPLLAQTLLAHVLLGTSWKRGATAALGAGKQTSQVAGVDTGTGTTGNTGIHTHAAGRLGADGAGCTSLGVGQQALRAAWALDVTRLGVVHESTLLGLGNVLVAAGHVPDHATLGV